MSIYYSLYQNKLTEATDLYAAKVLINNSADLNTIADRIVSQGSTVTRTDVIAVLEGAVAAVESFLLEGDRVNFGGLFDVYPRIKGKFNGISDHYDPSRHQVDVSAMPGSRIRKTFRENASVSKLETVLPKPMVLEYIDLGTGEINNHITRNGIGTIHGSRLAFDPSDPEEGIFFCCPDSSYSQVTAIQKNKPSELVFMVPNMLGETFRLEVRKRFSPEGELRVGQLDATLTATAVMAAVG